jgi:hypothetical protein
MPLRQAFFIPPLPSSFRFPLPHSEFRFHHSAECHCRLAHHMKRPPSSVGRAVPARIVGQAIRLPQPLLSFAHPSAPKEPKAVATGAASPGGAGTSGTRGDESPVLLHPGGVKDNHPPPAPGRNAFCILVPRVSFADGGLHPWLQPMTPLGSDLRTAPRLIQNR